MNTLERDSNSLLNGSEEAVPDTAAAFRRYVAKHGYPSRRDPIRRRPVWAATAAVCALIALFSFAPARSWGQKILSMLRVQKVAVVPVDMQALSAANGHQKQLGQLISDRVVVTMQPGDPTPENSISAASNAAGFEVKALDALGTPSRILVRDEAAFHLQLDRDRMEALLEAVGRTDIAIPPQIDGAEVAVHIPRAVDIRYGQCSGTNREGCVQFTQMPSPAISIPASLKMADLAEAMLQLGGMSASEAAAFCQTVDWSSTLVIPVPRNASTTRTVPVDGVNGTLVQSEGRYGADYALIWVKDKRIFAITGSGAPDQALAVAESLH
jgi:hypothetical protein